jgi:hypothetical protein
MMTMTYEQSIGHGRALLLVGLSTTLSTFVLAIGKGDFLCRINLNQKARIGASATAQLGESA